MLLIGVIGMLTTAAAGIVTTALQAAFGILGTGVAILLFVVLGNPSSGGPFPPELLPEPWQTIGPYLPTGAATSAIRDIAYFPDAPLAKPFLVLGAWIVGGRRRGAAALTGPPQPRRARARARRRRRALGLAGVGCLRRVQRRAERVVAAVDVQDLARDRA